MGVDLTSALSQSWEVPPYPLSREPPDKQLNGSSLPPIRGAASRGCWASFQGAGRLFLVRPRPWSTLRAQVALRVKCQVQC